MPDDDLPPELLAGLQRRAATPSHHDLSVARERFDAPPRLHRREPDWRALYAVLPDAASLEALQGSLPDGTDAGHRDDTGPWLEVFVDERRSGVPDDLTDPFALLADRVHELGGRLWDQPHR